MSDKIHQRKSTKYKAALKKSIHNSDFEGMIKNIMLLAIKNNTDSHWQMGPRTFMELCQVMIKYREAFGSDTDMADLMLVLDNSKAESE